MPHRRVLCVSVWLVSFACLVFGEDWKKESAELFEHANQLSDIRVNGSPAFVLRGQLKVLRDPSHPVTASYTEFWASPSLVRTEISAEGFRRVTVINGRKRWELNEGGEAQDIVSAAYGIAYRASNSPVNSPEGPKVMERSSGSWTLRCVLGHDDEFGRRQEFCFDKSRGQLVASSLPFFVKGGELVRKCAFTDFQQFGSKLFPHSVYCMEGEQQVFQARVTQLALQEPDQSMFEMPAGAKEFANCPVHLSPPRAVESPEPARIEGGPVVLLLDVTRDGKPDGITVTTSGGAEMDNAAIQAVSHWKFKPAMCEGEPMETRISVAVTSHINGR